MNMKFRPLHDRLLVERLEEDQPKSKGGIIIPDTAKEKPLEGKILAAGTGKLTADGKVVAMSVKVGDRILFGKYAGTEIKLNGKDNLLVLREEDVLGVLN